MDVFVAESHRRRGLGRALVRFALQHPEHRDIPRWLLGTKDAHGVYAHEGFRPLEEPGRVMERKIAAGWERGP
jgi:GNAT superfamily N-acetyltransferase